MSPRPRRLLTVLFAITKPSPLREGDDTTSSNATLSKPGGQDLNVTCMHSSV